jgi:hypothetical protein
MSEQKSWQQEAAEEQARRNAERVRQLEIETEWVRSGRPDGLEMCYRLEEILEHAAVGLERCRWCGALLYLIENPEGLGRRDFDRAGTRHWCEEHERAVRRGE